MSGSIAGSGYFWLRRLNSFFGLWLSLVYIFFFLIPYSSVVSGSSTFDFLGLVAAKTPLIGVFEVLFILVPLLLHLTVSLSIIYGSTFNVVSYGSYRNWMYALQRASGILLISFLAYHIYFTKLAFAFTGKYADFAYVQQLLSPHWVKWIYWMGIACASFHIGNGISFALMKWGITVSRKSQDAVAMAMWVVIFGLFIWGARIMISF